MHKHVCVCWSTSGHVTLGFRKRVRLYQDGTVPSHQVALRLVKTDYVASSLINSTGLLNQENLLTLNLVKLSSHSLEYKNALFLSNSSLSARLALSSRKRSGHLKFSFLDQLVIFSPSVFTDSFEPVAYLGILFLADQPYRH